MAKKRTTVAVETAPPVQSLTTPTIRLDTPKAVGINTKAISYDDVGLICVSGQLENAPSSAIAEVWAMSNATQITSPPSTPPSGAEQGVDTTTDNYFFFRGSGYSSDHLCHLLEVPTPSSTPQTYWVYVWVKQASVGWLTPYERQFQYVEKLLTDCGDHDA